MANLHAIPTCQGIITFALTVGVGALHPSARQFGPFAQGRKTSLSERRQVFIMLRDGIASG